MKSSPIEPSIRKLYLLLTFLLKWLSSSSKKQPKVLRKKKRSFNLKHQSKFSVICMANSQIFCICLKKWLTKISLSKMKRSWIKTKDTSSWVIMSTEDVKALSWYAFSLLWKFDIQSRLLSYEEITNAKPLRESTDSLMKLKDVIRFLYGNNFTRVLTICH